MLLKRTAVETPKKKIIRKAPVKSNNHKNFKFIDDDGNDGKKDEESPTKQQVKKNSLSKLDHRYIAKINAAIQYIKEDAEESMDYLNLLIKELTGKENNLEKIAMCANDFLNNIYNFRDILKNLKSEFSAK